MTMDDLIQYNKNQSETYGWEPDLFGCDAFDSNLIQKIKEFQGEYGLSVDGMCGPNTYRRAWTARNEHISDYEIEHDDSDKSIVYNGEFYPIKWKKTVLWDHENGLTTKDGAYYSYAGKLPREPKFFVTHWDVCLSSKSCASVLANRGISVHFCIDNDGTIYQLLDMQHGAWHAGGRSWNQSSVGVEISNAYYTKYQSWYVSNGFGERPIQSGVKCHNSTLEDHLGFYPIQLEALAALYEAVHNALGIPYQTPENKYGVDSKARANDFEGFCSHYHLTSGKIDVAGVDLDDICSKAKELE